MAPEELAKCLEEAFGGLEPPSLDELAAADTYMDDTFEDAVKIDELKTRAWQDLRPIRQWLGDTAEIVLLSPRAFQY
jgi:hypothetical protein